MEIMLRAHQPVEVGQSNLGAGIWLMRTHSLLFNLCAARCVSGYRRSELTHSIHDYFIVLSWRPLQYKLSPK